MKKIQILVVIAELLYLSAPFSFATNGDIMEGIGAVSEALGGTGVAAPQDSLTALVNNPAGLAFTPASSQTEISFGVTFFQPTVKAKLSTPGGTLSGDSDDPVSFIPFLSYSQPLDEKWNIGFGAYGVSGMGVDYRGKGWDLDGNPANGYEGEAFSKYSSMKLAPAVSYKITDDFSVGAALHVNYSMLDLDQKKTDDLSAGATLGAIYKIGSVQVGASYTTPQESTFKDVYNFDAFMGDTEQDNLTLEQPAVYAVGVAWSPTEDWLIEFNTKYLTWADSEGYDDFDWENQLVYAIGTQYRVTEKFVLRAGFNYAENPVKEHNGWNPQGVTEIQGKSVPTMGYELLRNVGFPAIVESHLTLGFGVALSDTLALNVSYAHAFEKTIRSSSMGDAIQFESSLSEDSIGVGLTWVY